MDSTVVEVRVAEGDVVVAGQTVMVLSAMKMETQVVAPCAGVVVAVQHLEPGDTVTRGLVVAVLAPADGNGVAAVAAPQAEDTWAPVLDEVSALQGLALQRLAPGSDDPGVVRQRNRGKLTCRERIALLLDEGSFREVGSLAGFASYDDEGGVAAFTPANHVGGWGTIDGRTAVVCADDFTSRGGHADGAIGAKSLYLDRLSMQLQTPSVRLLDGSSGGGSVAAMVPEQKKDGREHREGELGRHPGRPAAGGRRRRFVPPGPPRGARSTPGSWPPCPSSTCCSAASSASARPRRCSGTSP